MSPREIIWFPEPKTPDPTYGRRGESTFDFLNRSTWVRAAAMRAFINEQLNYFPEHAQRYFYGRFHNSWESTYFEFIVARSLQVFGASIEFETALISGSKPDFTAHFEDCSIVVEATAPVYQSMIAVDMQRNIDLMNLVEECLPEGWLVGVWQLPAIDQNTSKKPLKKALLEIFSGIESMKESHIEIERETDWGQLRMHFLRAPGKRGILNEPMYTFWSDADGVISNAYNKKRRQVRGSDLPVVLAIQGPPMEREFHDFDNALLGRTSGMPLDSYKPSDKLGGAFSLWKDRSPNIDAVLAYFSPGWTECSDPVLYVNPRSCKQLPRVLTQLHQRALSQDKIRIENILPAQTNIINSKIGFVSSNIR